jgi:hypothetical protein
MCSVDFSVAAAPTDGHKVKPVLRGISSKCTLGPKLQKEVCQYFSPCYWVMRILDDDRRLLKLDGVGEEEDTLEAALKGMII